MLLNKVKLPLPPTTNSTYKAVYSSRLKRTVFFSSYETKKWKKQAQEILSHYADKPTEEPIFFHIQWYLKFNRDIDGGLKLLMDSLQGVIIKNDKQVVKLVAEKSFDKLNPRVEVSVGTMMSDLTRLLDMLRSSHYGYV